MKLYFSDLENLFNSWLKAVPARKVSLDKMKIYRINNVEKKPGKTTAEAVITDVETMGQKKATVVIPAGKADQLKHAGVFYKTENGSRFIPTDEVQGHIFSDFFNMPTKRAENLSSEGIKQADLELAGKFRKVGQMIFIAKNSELGFSELVGAKSAETPSKRAKSLFIAKRLKGEFWYSCGYQAGQASMEFEFECHNDEWKTADGTPYWLSFSDTATGRRSIRIDLVAGVHGRKYVIDNMEVSHRSSMSSNKIADKVQKMVEKHGETVLNTAVEAQAISDSCLKYVPAKTRKMAWESIWADDVPIDAAYDAMSDELFNPRQKQHRTWGYDGGRRKYELALGQMLRCC